MARLIISVQAELDVSMLLTMLEDKAGRQVAMRYRREIENLFERLMLFPESGARRPEPGRHARIGVIAPYVVIYDHEFEDVVILRVLDGRRDITRRLVRE